MSNRSRRTWVSLVFLLGLACGVGASEARHSAVRHDAVAPLPSGPSAAEVALPPAEPGTTRVAPPPLSLSEQAKQLDRTRTELATLILRTLRILDLPKTERRDLTLALGYLGTPEAIDWLVDHHDYLYFEPPVTPRAAEPRDLSPWYPSLEALNQIGVPAVPQMVEAYITWPADRWPDGFLVYGLDNNRRSARVAYLYAQGYLHGTKEKGHHRDAVLKLIRELGSQLHHGDLPYPPPWMGTPEK